MKTAVSIPDDVFEGAERLARRTKKTRSQLFSDAIKEYLARHAPEDVTDAWIESAPNWAIRKMSSSHRPPIAF
jgi:metal-responsive CopG/Arc/MetJ family transcriptional regulator